MYENVLCEIKLGPVTFWPPALARRLGEFARQSATVAITAMSMVGIAMGFAGASEHEDTALQLVLHTVAVFTGLIG